MFFTKLVLPSILIFHLLLLCLKLAETEQRRSIAGHGCERAATRYAKYLSYLSSFNLPNSILCFTDKGNRKVNNLPKATQLISLWVKDSKGLHPNPLSTTWLNQKGTDGPKLVVRRTTFLPHCCLSIPWLWTSAELLGASVFSLVKWEWPSLLG